MVWQRIRIALFVCTVLAVSASTAFAQEEGGKDKDKDKDKKEAEVLKTPPVEQPHPGGIIGGGGGGCGAPCGTRTIYVTECVPETYTARRTVYRSECRQETYTAYRRQDPKRLGAFSDFLRPHRFAFSRALGILGVWSIGPNLRPIPPARLP